MLAIKEFRPVRFPRAHPTEDGDGIPIERIHPRGIIDDSVSVFFSHHILPDFLGCYHMPSVPFAQSTLPDSLHLTADVALWLGLLQMRGFSRPSVSPRICVLGNRVRQLITAVISSLTLASSSRLPLDSYSTLTPKYCSRFCFTPLTQHGSSRTAGGQPEAECSLSALSDAALEQLSIYDKDLYLERDCVNGATPLPVHCNYMGLGQECRGCFLTCDGATKYMGDFSEEIAVWVRSSVFCCFCFCREREAAQNIAAQHGSDPSVLGQLLPASHYCTERFP